MDNPYRAPRTQEHSGEPQQFRWWPYLSAHLIAVVTCAVATGMYIIDEVPDFLQAPSLVAVAFLPVAGFVDVYLWGRALGGSRRHLRLATADSVMTAAHLYAILLPAVSP